MQPNIAGFASLLEKKASRAIKGSGKHGPSLVDHCAKRVGDFLALSFLAIYEVLALQSAQPLVGNRHKQTEGAREPK
jgi:hypothetical protein